MTNEDLMILILDKLDWDYDKEMNPNRYNNTQPLIAGVLLLAILNNETIAKAAAFLKLSYKVVNTCVTRELVPVLGNLHGGGATWRFRLEHFIEYQECGKCAKNLPYSDYHKDTYVTRGVYKICKSCRIEQNALDYKKDSVKESHKRSQEKNYSAILARNSLYRAERAKRYVSWADLGKIKEKYAKCPKGMHVDHIIPLKGELVSGLHVDTNLQYLTAEENIKKGNTFTIE